MRTLVGYTANAAGRDALALGARLAAIGGDRLDIVIVHTVHAPVDPSDTGYAKYVRAQSERWLATALANVPDGVEAFGHIEEAASTAEGLEEAAERLGAEIIVVGAARGGGMGRNRVGSIANGLLHSSSVPVALAPRGTAANDEAITRITAAVGTRPGAEDLLDTSIAFADEADVPLRLISLISLDVSGRTAGAEQAALERHAASILETARERLGSARVEQPAIATGRSIEHAVRNAEWQPGDLVLVGSARLARRGTVFMGATASSMLRALPVPLVVVPRPAKQGAQR